MIAEVMKGLAFGPEQAYLPSFLSETVTILSVYMCTSLKIVLYSDSTEANL